MDLIVDIIGKSIPKDHDTFHILLVIMVFVWTSGRIFRHLHLSPVIGEILAGLLIGPAMLDLISENETINVLGELGIFFMMFHAGLDTNANEFFHSSKKALFISLGGITFLILLIFGLMQLLGFSFITSIFIATICSITSLPIVFRTLKDAKLTQTKIGHLVVSATVIGDIVGFVLLSIVISLATSNNFDLLSILLVFVKVILFLLGITFLGVKILPYFTKFLSRTDSKGFTLSLIIALFFGLLAEMIGLHIILGAYLAGLFINQEITHPQLFRKIEDRVFGISHSFLGPIFFAIVGMQMSLSSFIKNPWLIIILFLAIVLGQLFSTGLLTYYLNKFTIKEALCVAGAMTGRGVTEIIMAKIGYETFITNKNGDLVRLLSLEMFSAVVALSLFIGFFMPFLVNMFKPKLHQEN